MKKYSKTAALAWRYLWSRPLAAALNLLLLAPGAGSHHAGAAGVHPARPGFFERDLEVLTWWWAPRAARCSSSWRGVPSMCPRATSPARGAGAAANPLVAQVVPLSLGDSYQGYRIVGTTPDYVAHYRATLAEGRAVAAAHGRCAGRQRSARHRQTRSCWQAPGGATFIGSHGLGGAARPWRPPLPRQRRAGALAAACRTGSSSPALNRSGRCTKPPRPTPKTWKS